jgi:competence protein ComEA
MSRVGPLSQFFRSSILEQTKLYWPLVAMGLGLCFGGVGVWQAVALQNQAKVPVTISESQVGPCSLEEASHSQSLVVIDVAGGVENPGVYSLEIGSLVADAIAAAGGWSSQAATLEVAQRINLAEKLSDGQKIYVPVVTDALGGLAERSTRETAAQPSKISLNFASRKELMSLPGIGERRADLIIAARPYSSVAELVTKGVLTQGVFDAIREQLTL